MSCENGRNFQMSKRLESVRVPKWRIDKMAEKLKDEPKDSAISFEYVLLYLFPSVWENIQKAIYDSHTEGYLKGLAEGKKV